jgi:precorrin-2 dehydrogenase/sirohydrochlorin ferrochelatase
MIKVFLPLNIRIDDKKILFIGGGNIALHKIQTVERYTRNITIVATEIHDALNGKGFEIVCKKYEETDLDGFFLVYAATDSFEVNSKVKADAAARGIMVNVVDNRELSDFISPAVIKENEMTIAVSSNGQDVKKAVAWRNRIREMFRDG